MTRFGRCADPAGWSRATPCSSPWSAPPRMWPTSAAGDPDAAWHLNAALKLLAELDGRLRQIGGPEHDAFAELLAAASGPAPPGHPA